MTNKNNDREYEIKLYSLIYLIIIVMTAILTIDWMYDMHVCKQEFLKKIDISPVRVNTYVIDDVKKLNFGKEISCTIFWEEDGWLSSVDFLSGTLTFEQIYAEKYWNKKSG